MGKHDREQETKVIQLRDYQPQHGRDWKEARAEYEYEEEEERGEEQSPPGESPEAEKLRRRWVIPKAVYTISLVLVAVIIALGLWINREYLSWENLTAWAKLQVLGEESGDGFPAPITGSNVLSRNFMEYSGSAVLLSNTALSMVNAEGKEALSLRHNLNQPVLKSAGGQFLMYNSGSTGYTVLSGMEVSVSGVAQEDIICGCAAPNGKFALGLSGSYGASRLEVYLKNGSLQYEYPFADDYITAAALNQDGSQGVVCTVRSDKGEMVSKLMVFDFMQTEPLAQYETRGNMLLDAYWGENGVIYGVGDAALVTGKASELQFSEYDYQGRQLTAFQLDAGRAFLSISAYEHAGPSSLMVVNGGEALGETNPLKVEMDKRIEAISVSGGTAGLLAGGEAVFLDYYTGAELGRADAGADAKNLALSSERKAYILGVSEVRVVEVG